MIQLPYKYQDYFGNDYEIIGWKGLLLQTRCNGRIFTLNREQTMNLMKSLGLRESEIPGQVNTVLPSRVPVWELEDE